MSSLSLLLETVRVAWEDAWEAINRADLETEPILQTYW